MAAPRLRIVAPDREPRVLRFDEKLRDSIAQRGIRVEYERLEGLGLDARIYYEATGHAAFNFHFRSLAVRPSSYEERRGPYGETRCRNIEFAAPGGRGLALDLYLPAQGRRPFPVVVYIFGGAFRVGSKNDCMAGRLVADGYAVASISYRLSGEAAFPAQLADCKAAIRWLRAHADSYGLDPDRIGAWGMSAGAYLAVMLGVTGGEDGLDLNGSNEGYSSAVQAVCDFYGPTDFLRMDSFIGSFSHDAPQSAESMLLRGPIQAHRDRAERASPLSYIREGAKLPPFLIVHDPRDMYVPFDQSELLVAALRRVGAEASLVEARETDYPYHGFDDSGEARSFIRSSVDDFFAHALRGRALQE
jgi:Esterase/lipase